MAVRNSGHCCCTLNVPQLTSVMFSGKNLQIARFFPFKKIWSIPELKMLVQFCTRISSYMVIPFCGHDASINKYAYTYTHTHPHVNASTHVSSFKTGNSTCIHIDLVPHPSFPFLPGWWCMQAHSRRGSEAMNKITLAVFHLKLPWFSCTIGKTIAWHIQGELLLLEKLK